MSDKTESRKPYTVADGHTLRAQGRDHGAGEVVHLLDRDAQRLLESGAILAGNVKAEEGANLASGTAQEVIASLEGMSADQLAAVKAAEGARKEGPRKTVLTAIEAAQAKLAQPEGDSDQAKE